MTTIGFKTRPCKPRHPFAKGKVERLIRFVRENFLAGRKFYNATDLNEQALIWCAEQSSRYRRALAHIPADKRAKRCMTKVTRLTRSQEVALRLCPRRRISFDGFVNYKGRRFCVPCWYSGKHARIGRDRRIHPCLQRHGSELAIHPAT